MEHAFQHESDTRAIWVCSTLARIDLGVCYHPLKPICGPRRLECTFAQDPSSEDLGTTVWDASIVLAKYIEKVFGPKMARGCFVLVKECKSWTLQHDFVAPEHSTLVCLFS